MSERAFDVWVYDQLHPNEKIYSEGGLGFHKPSFLEKIPPHILAVEQKNSLSKTKKQTMEAKPICVVYVPVEAFNDAPNITWKDCNRITVDFESKKPDYHWFFIPSNTHETMEFKVFYEKDFTPIKYEELKSIIQQAIK